ncbi:MAG: hypothetical protein QE277_03200 [Flectobacillus sp.]|nr:hypothetical protein [Flectobacillus sp.]
MNLKKKKNISWIVLSLSVLIGLHLKLFSIGSFQVSLGFLVIPIWVYKTYRISIFKLTFFEKILLLFLVIYPFLPGEIRNWSEYFNTYGQYFITYYMVIRCINKRPLYSKIEVEKMLYVFQRILLTTVVVQYILVVVAGQISFFNIFQKYQLYYSLDYNLAIGRMKAFYLEPSYLGFVTLSVFWTRLYLNSDKVLLLTPNVIYTIIILFFAKSSSSFLGFSIVYIYYIMSNTSLQKKPLMAFLYIGIIAFLVVRYWDSISILLRLEELSGKVDTPVSGFMRVTLPIQLLQKMINEGFFLGKTFGQLDEYVFRMTLGYTERSISNSLFLILGYWGILNIIPLSWVIYYFVFKANPIQKSFIVLTFFSLNNSGAFVTSQFGFLAFLLPLFVFNFRYLNNYRQ